MGATKSTTEQHTQESLRAVISRRTGDVAVCSPRGDIVAECYADIRFEGEGAREEAKANAKLFAVAHELLVAMQFAIKFYDQLTPADAERMSAIVARATGSAS